MIFILSPEKSLEWWPELHSRWQWMEGGSGRWLLVADVGSWGQNFGLELG
jgi:hypothetical protein